MADTNTQTKKPAKRKTTRKAGARKPQARKTVRKAKKTPIEQASGLIAELTRTNFEETVETARAVLQAKDVRSAFELQNDYVRASFKRNFEAARELNDIASKAVREAVTPVTERVTDAVERLRAA